MEPRTDDTDLLRVLIADERKDRLVLVAPMVVAVRLKCACGPWPCAAH